jgi:hypothetical protein
MNWSMPRPVLQVVAVLIGVACVGAFAMGVATAPPKSRLPGQRIDGVTGEAIQAADAIALGDERIEGAAPPPELSDEEKARLADEKEAKEEAAAARAAAAGVMPVAPATPTAAAPVEAAPQAAAPPPPPPKVEEPPV